MSITEFSKPIFDRFLDSIDFIGLLLILWNGKWILIYIAFVFYGIGCIHILLKPPIYKGEALIQIETKSSGFAAITDLSDKFLSNSSVPTEIEVFKAKKITISAIEKFLLNIEVKPNTMSFFGDFIFNTHNFSDDLWEPFFLNYFDYFSKFAWGGEKLLVNSFNVPVWLFGKEFTVTVISDEEYLLKFNGKKVKEGKIGVDYYLKDIGVDINIKKIVGRKGASFTLIHHNPVVTLKEISESIIINEERQNSGILKVSKLGEDKQQIANILDYMLATYQRQNIEYNSIEASKSIEFIAKQLPDAESNVRRAEDELYNYKLNNEIVNLDVKMKVILEDVQQTERKLEELKLLEFELLEKFSKTEFVYRQFIHKRETLAQRIEELERELAKIPTEQFNMYRLQRDVKLYEEIYIELLNKHESLKIVQAGTSGSIRVIDPATVHPTPVLPQKYVFMGFDIFLICLIYSASGFIACCAWLIFMGRVVSGIDTVEQMQNEGFNVYNSILYDSAQLKLTHNKTNKPSILSLHSPSSLSVEALKSIRTTILHDLLSSDNKLIMIAGPTSGVGKSFVAKNISALLANMGLKVLLVDADMRLGYLHNTFNADAKKGLSTYLLGDESIEDIVIKTDIVGLDLITRGGETKKSADLLESQKFIDFCKTVTELYDYVIIDTPPILSLADASIVGKQAGITVMVVRQNTTFLKEINAATKKLGALNVHVAGYVLNGVQKKSKDGRSNISYEYN